VAPGDIVLRRRGLELRDAPCGVTRLQGRRPDACAPARSSAWRVSPATARAILLEVLSGLRGQRRAARRSAASFEPARWLDPRAARALGLAHVPEDRHARRW
jgi:hypothetical protein